MAKKMKMLDSNKVIEPLKMGAEENGYTLVFMGTEDKIINVVTYPFKPTFCSQEDVARALADVMNEEGLFKDENVETMSFPVLAAVPSDLRWPTCGLLHLQHPKLP